MRTINVSRRNTKTIAVVRHLLRTVKVTVDLSAPGVVIPVCPTEGTITLDFNLATRDLRASKNGLSAVCDFDGTICEIFVPLAAITNIESVPASNEVAERALSMIG